MMLRRHELHPFGPSGYTVSYPSCDAATLREIRVFQRDVATRYPGWVTRLDYTLDGCELHVFPLAELAPAVIAASSRYGRVARYGGRSYS